jgi:cell division protein FtsI/penicillin-binding protein 2
MRRWIYIAAGVLGALVVVFVAVKLASGKSSSVAVQPGEDPALALARSKVPTNQAAMSVPMIAGLDLLQMRDAPGGMTAPAAENRVAHLTIDPELQKTAVGLLTANKLPEAAVVMVDVATSQILVYASHIEKGTPRDLCAEATAPAASVFKIVTGATLYEEAHVSLDAKHCYSGGEQRIHAIDLVEDPAKDKWCVTLGGAMGRSINTVFARLAKAHLAPTQLEMMARKFGFGDSVPFDVPVQPSAVNIPTEPLEFARTAAGFWNTTLSPMQAAWMSAIVARGGEAVRPTIVKDVTEADGKVAYTSPQPPVVRRVVTRETASALTTMLDHTVAEGTSYRAFHDGRSHSFLPQIPVAGKTGTLTDAQTSRFYTWFSGFAPSHPTPNNYRTVAIAVLVVNEPTWAVKANVIARDMLRAYFAKDKAPGVSKPSLAAVARHDPKKKK